MRPVIGESRSIEALTSIEPNGRAFNELAVNLWVPVSDRPASDSLVQLNLPVDNLVALPVVLRGDRAIGLDDQSSLGVYEDHIKRCFRRPESAS